MGKILNPHSSFLRTWNRNFAISCVLALSLDPLFFYIPVIDRKLNCFGLDKKLEVVACVLRSYFDIIYMLHIIVRFHTAFLMPSSRGFGMIELVIDPSAIAQRYLSFYFIIDILSILPLPQVVLLLIAPNSNAMLALKYVVLIQYVPRFIRMYPLYRDVPRSSDIRTKSAWARVAYNFYLYMLASHVVGSFWYLFSLERQDRCWRKACTTLECGDYNYKDLYCRKKNTRVNTYLNDFCSLVEPDGKTNSTVFNFGIYLDALQSGVMETSDFSEKFFYCFWWGLRNLSSLGQNLKTSTSTSEIFFAIFIAIFGLILFTLIIGNIQKYLQSMIIRIEEMYLSKKRIEEMTVKRQDTEQWMSHRMLPDNLRNRVRRFEEYKWQQTGGVEEDRLIRSFPRDLRRDINRHLCLALLTRVPVFKQMNEQLLEAMCDRLKPALFTERSHIVREGDLVYEMLFINRGKLLTTTTNSGRIGFVNSGHLHAADFCGEELLTWSLDPNSHNLPSSTRTVQALTEVEAFALSADDLKFVASQFQRLHSKQVQHTIRFYSQQWRTWAACFIQAAWRRHRKKKHEKALHEAEERLRGIYEKKGEKSLSFGATSHASRFASNRHRILRYKSAELDFSSKDD